MADPTPLPERPLSFFALFGLATIPFWLAGAVLVFFLYPWLFLSIVLSSLFMGLLLAFSRPIR